MKLLRKGSLTTCLDTYYNSFEKSLRNELGYTQADIDKIAKELYDDTQGYTQDEIDNISKALYGDATETTHDGHQQSYGDWVQCDVCSGTDCWCYVERMDNKTLHELDVNICSTQLNTTHFKGE